MDVERVLRAILNATGWSQERLADELETTQATVSRWLRGREPRGQKMDAIRDLARECRVLGEAAASIGFHEDLRTYGNAIPVMGYVGAGGDISPEYEQVPTDGLEQIDLPYALGIVADPIAFQIRGESMMPRYNDGDLAIVEREQPWNVDSMIGEEAVVRTSDSRRYLKKIMPGRKPNTFNLVSVNAPTIEGARIIWASPVRLIIPNVGLRRTGHRTGRG